MGIGMRDELIRFGRKVAVSVLPIVLACGGSSGDDAGSTTRLDSHSFSFPDSSAIDTPLYGDPAGPGDEASWDDGSQLIDVPPIPDTQPALDVPFPDTSKTDLFVEDTTTPDDNPVPNDTFTFPEATDDCEPLGLPSNWAGNFEGVLDSNIPDMFGYTFKGPVDGAISFEITCVNQEYRILGLLEGGQTNCALESGCPFFGYLSGTFEVPTGKITGQIKQASIDYTVLKVLAAGKFTGLLHNGDTFEGDWDGQKTDVVWANGDDATTLDWVTAGGGGTWETTAVE